VVTTGNHPRIAAGRLVMKEMVATSEALAGIKSQVAIVMSPETAKIGENVREKRRRNLLGWKLMCRQ